MDHSNKVIKSKEVIGVKVYTTTKDKLGEVVDIVIDKATGRVAYVVLETSSFLGMSGKLFALPWHALRYNEQSRCFLLEVEKQAIFDAQGFNKQCWPDIADSAFFKISEIESLS